MKTIRQKPVAIVGYSGHSYVIIDILLNAGRMVVAYCDQEEKKFNPFHLKYLGRETELMHRLKSYDYFLCIGNNSIREKVYGQLKELIGDPINAIHPSAVISASVKMEDGVMIAANATINPLAYIGKGVICNTSSSIDHECVLGDFSHIAPGAVLCGNVKVGKGTFVGANSVITQGITVGNNVIVGAGAVVIRDVPDNTTVVGNPQRILVQHGKKLIAA